MNMNMKIAELIKAPRFAEAMVNTSMSILDTWRQHAKTCKQKSDGQDTNQLNARAKKGNEPVRTGE